MQLNSFHDGFCFLCIVIYFCDNILGLTFMSVTLEQVKLEQACSFKRRRRFHPSWGLNDGSPIYVSVWLPHSAFWDILQLQSGLTNHEVSE